MQRVQQKKTDFSRQVQSNVTYASAAKNDIPKPKKEINNQWKIKNSQIKTTTQLSGPSYKDIMAALNDITKEISLTFLIG